ncbi:MAG: YggS family pyridoxal phosphate-dependent enzyme [Beijerinckiaceae bacterium]
MIPGPAACGSESILDRFAKVRHEVSRAALASGRGAAEVTLVVASKTQGEKELRPLLAAGHRVFGENRVQEAIAKWPPLRAEFPDLELRLIGPLQSNKAREAVAFFDVIETIDRPRLAKAIADEIGRQGKAPRLYIEVNTGDEPQKAGISPRDADSFIRQCREEYGLVISGLMCVPPVGEQASPHFALLGQIAKRNGLADLSMGMTADYPLAIQLGATHVRIGTAIFGVRTG